MEFTFPGSHDRPGGPISGASNENRFTFGKPTIGAARKLNAEVLEAKAFIEGKVNEFINQKNEAVKEYSVADEIIKLKALFDSNAISADEYEQLKYNLIHK
ncbi:MAG: SHOCT domain-containing protein [Bacteroidaceae bacterium]|nr:SHOCT domain-containing protein [Bacteroidaceae bacterium]